ncbi:MAG: peptidoglycan bridge formation glycyltransferase FemA/FemB family protein [Candidatus Levybacteria bacterium]|nr:peptidoglycan bridge formation glycyltransferase FemA/FemB family protein [Candidatus Levybacteria bacterium]
MNSSTFNKTAAHPLQSFEWGEFRKKTGVKVILGDSFQLTIHKIPHTPWNIGYLPKSAIPTKKQISELIRIGREEHCVFIQLEPNVDKESNYELGIRNYDIRPAAHPLFTRYTFVLDLTKSEDELLKAMHPKTRYNIRVAQKHGVEVVEDNSDKAFREYLKLTEETTNRQKFYAHTKRYHEKMWETLKISNFKFQISNSQRLTAHLLTAKYKNKTLVAWILFVFKDTLYYPYGASSNEHREVMASNLVMWEAIKFGKKLGLKKFDMWGALGPNPDKNDKWYGFHRFKEGYGGRHVGFIGSYDLVINPFLYEIYKVTDTLRWFLLKLKHY